MTEINKKIEPATVTLTMEELNKLIAERVQAETVKAVKVEADKAFDSSNLEALVRQAKNESEPDTGDRIRFETLDIISNGFPSKITVARIDTSERRGVSIVQTVDIALVLSKPQFADQLAEHFKNIYEKMGEKLPFSAKTNAILVSRGMVSIKHIEHLKRTTIELLISPKYGIPAYVEVFNEIKDHIKSV